MALMIKTGLARSKLRGVVFVAVWLLMPATVQAGAPTEQLRSTVNEVLQILNKPKLAGQNAKEERRNRLRQVIYPRFDFADMARRSLGSTWRRIDRDQQREFLRLFTELLEQSYANNIESYNGEKILYGREAQDGDFAEVDTKLVTKQGDEYSLNYRLHKIDGEWKVYDIVIENVSIVNNYRSQFNRLLAKVSFAELLNKIRETIRNAR